MNANDCRSVHDAIPEWVGGGLADADRFRLRRHLDRCPDCRAAVGEWRRFAGALAADRPQVTAPALDVALAKVDLAMRRPGPSPALRLLRWASAVGLLLLVGVALTRGSEPQGEPAAPAAQLAGRPPASPAGSATFHALPTRHYPARLPDGVDPNLEGDLQRDDFNAGEWARLVDARLPAGSIGRLSGQSAASGFVLDAATTSLPVALPGPADGATAPAASRATSGGEDEPISGDSSARTGTPPPPSPTTAAATEAPPATQATATGSPTLQAPATQPAAFVLEGEVVDDLDQPIAGAYLQVWTEPTGAQGPVAYLTESDPNGRFSLALPAGGYLVHGEALGFEAAWWGGPDRGSARRLDLPAAPDVPRPRLLLRRLPSTPPPTKTPSEPPVAPATPSAASEALDPTLLGSKPRPAQVV